MTADEFTKKFMREFNEYLLPREKEIRNQLEKIQQHIVLNDSRLEIFEQRLDELNRRIKHLSQRASVGEAEAETYANVHYGGTINLGAYNNRKINISVHGIPPKDIDITLDELEQKFNQRENALRRSKS